MRRALVAAAILLAASCARKVPTLPAGDGTPFPDFAAAYDAAVARCRGVQTLSAALDLSGRAGRTRLRGTIHAGFAAPDGLRLEGVGPFGRTVFVLVAKGGASTLLLPRDDRVLRDAPPASIVEALAGVALDPGELRAALTGCGLGIVEPAAGRRYARGVAAVDAGTTTLYLEHRQNRWRVIAVARGPLTIHYGAFAGDRPSTVRIRTAGPDRGTAADLTLRLSQVDINMPLSPAVFRVDVPRDAVPLTLEELRRSGPLGEAASSGGR